MKRKVYTIVVVLMIVFVLGVIGGIETNRLSLRLGFILTVFCGIVLALTAFLLRLEDRRDNNRITRREMNVKE